MAQPVSKTWIKKLCKERKVRELIANRIIQEADNLTEAQIDILINPRRQSWVVNTMIEMFKSGYTAAQMLTILSIGSGIYEEHLLKAIQTGVDIKDIQLLSAQYSSSKQMSGMLKLLAKGLSFDEAKKLIPQDLKESKVDAVVSAVNCELTDEQMAPLYEKDWTYYKARFYCEWIAQGNTIDGIQDLLENDTIKDWWEACRGLEEGLSLEAVKLYSLQDFDTTQRFCISQSLLKGVPFDMVVLYAKPNIETRKMIFINQEARAQYLTYNQLKGLVAYARTYSIPQLKEIVEGFKAGLSEAQVHTYVREWNSAHQMMKERYKLLNQKKDEYYKKTTREHLTQFFATKKGITIKSAGILVLFLAILLSGLWIMQNPDIVATHTIIFDILGVVSEVLFYLLIVRGLMESFRGLIFMMSPHPDTAFSHMFNVVVSLVLAWVTMTYAPNAIIAIAFQFLIMMINSNIAQYLYDNKYYS